MPNDFLRAFKILKANPVKNRGHAYRLINDAGIKTNKDFFNGVVSYYEFRTGKSLGLTNSQKRKLEAKRKHMHLLPLKEQARLMNIKEVRSFLYDNYSLLDELFFHLDDLHRYEGMWPELTREDFRHYYRHHVLYVEPGYDEDEVLVFDPITYDGDDIVVNAYQPWR